MFTNQLNSKLLLLLISGLISMLFAAEPRLLTTSDQALICPTWSPAGDYIAASGSGYRGVWLIRVADGKLIQLSDANAAGFGMAWSHTGRYLATTENKAGQAPNRTALRVYDMRTLTGSNYSDYSKRLTGTVSWTPDDQGIFLVGHFPLHDAYFKFASQASGHGYNLFSIIHDQVVEYNSESEEMITILAGQRVLNLQIAPDGKTFVCEKTGGGLIIGNKDGILAQTDQGERPRWSVDGQYLVFQITKDNGHEILASDIWRIKADGTGLTQLTDTPDAMEFNPSLAPDNKKVVFENLVSRHIYELDLGK